MTSKREEKRSGHEYCRCLKDFAQLILKLALLPQLYVFTLLDMSNLIAPNNNNNNTFRLPMPLSPLSFFSLVLSHHPCAKGKINKTITHGDSLKNASSTNTGKLFIVTRKNLVSELHSQDRTPETSLRTYCVLIIYCVRAGSKVTIYICRGDFCVSVSKIQRQPTVSS